MKYLDIHTPIKELESYLLSKGFLKINEHLVSIEKPGEGNMNVVLRITTNFRSFILKQSRPYVQKYQQIEAPLHRISLEHEFYKTVNHPNLSTHIPKIIGYDADDYLLVMHDLGKGEDLTSIYKNKSISNSLLQKLIYCLVLIHKNEVTKDFPKNLEMRQLNHQHIFVLPFLEENGFQLDDIQDGLQNLSIPYKKDKAIQAIVSEVGKKYLSQGNTLLHGDYYPGSWMTAKDNLYIIDPEFGFSGFAEFDIGVMAAHIIIATADESYLETIQSQYTLTANKKLITQVAGIEIMRRLIGLAQLPITRTISEKQYLLELARKMIVS